MKVLFCFLLCGSFVHADVSSSFRESARRVFNNALKHGVPVLDGLDVRSVLGKMDQVSLRQAVTNVAGRRGAFWMCNQITFNPQLVAAMPEYAQEVLYVHEYNGATTCSWKDDSYAYALYIWMVSYGEFFKPILSRLTWPASTKESVFAFYNKQTNFLGGSTVVGGGGDDRDINVKINALLCLRSYLTEGGCLPKSFQQQNMAKLIKGLLFLNWYVSDQVSEDDFRFHLPKDKGVLPIVLIHPSTYNNIVSNDSYIVAIMKLALIYADKAGL